MKKVEKKSVDFDYKSYEQEVLSGLMSGKNLIGDGGLLQPMIKHFVEAALQSELSSHLAREKKIDPTNTNKRNGKQSKKIRTVSGEIPIEYSRDRNSSFQPVTVKKQAHELSFGFDKQIIELYACGASLSDISLHLRNMYGVSMDEDTLSNVIRSTWHLVNTWHTRLLNPCYVVLFFDAVHITVCRDGVYSKRALYVVYGIKPDGYREIVALTLGQGGESSSEWSRCIADLKNRGVEEVFFICSDGLSGLNSVFEEHFPQAHIQRCIVHKIRNCFSLIDEKDRKLVLKQLKDVYTAVNESIARERLEYFKDYWQGKYDCIYNLWDKDWTALMACMNFIPTLRKLIYTNNPVENLNREIRRITKSKGGWKSEKALLIQLFHSLERKSKSWEKKVHAWASIKRELIAKFGERFNKYL